MKLLVNGQEESVESSMTVQAFLVNRGQDPKAVAVAVNEEFIPRTRFDKTLLQHGDSLEVVAPMQGG